MRKRSVKSLALSEGRRELLSTLLAILLPCGTGDAHVGDRVFPIFELPSSDLPDLHDDTLEDWDAVLVPSLDLRDFRGLYIDGEGDGGLAVNQEVIAFEVYLAWHYTSQRIFVGVNRYDAYYRFRLPPEPPPAQVNPSEGYENPGCCWAYDHVDFVIDGDHGGELCEEPARGNPERLEDYRRVDNRECQRYLAVPEAEGDRRIRAFGMGPLWAFGPPYADAGGFRFGESPSLSGHEIAVTPWDELQDDPTGSVRTRLESGQVIGLCIGIWDIDDFKWSEYVQTGGLPKPWSLYSSSGCDPFDSGKSVDAQLIPCTTGDCSGGSSASGSSAVRVDSWGRIKAAFAR